jgi:hypothetical protein
MASDPDKTVEETGRALWCLFSKYRKRLARINQELSAG